ncbi:unnamed protein product (macronuclear) [Paramecium tetraurelia]|uniref:Protein kinase domain-containing protein n=1 Tax=Paramecium tetraurelia TaxID=5888 RepID=A0BTC1_PARTE|nr:uncharacterized protein GSPATT00032020001 [Paramecium tetraurelia]CAK61788.1 unnamed protein product [Paramecium tetraurelia]|eukprot:XP_001429186.1 hypothetical protein (macronuclear) [Paramecium tetraurelia strain d4-2]
MQIPQGQPEFRPSRLTRYSNQTFYSMENCDVFNNQIENIDLMMDQIPMLQQVFEVRYTQHKENQLQKFYNMPNQERMFYMIDKDSGRIFDMRIPEQAKEIQEIMNGNTVNFIKDQAWNDFILLTKKMNEHLLDYAELGDAQSIETLLIPTIEYYLDVDTKGLDDWTALHFASNEGNLNIVDILIKHGATVDALTKFSRTPFFLTVMQNFIECANVLLQHNANINSQDKDGNTPLHIASQMGSTDMIAFLLEKKADPNIRNSFNQNCIQICCDANSLQIYIKYGYAHNEESYERTIIPGTNFLLRNSRYDHVMKFMTKEKQTEGQTANAQNQVTNQNNTNKKISKFQNLAKFQNVNLLKHKMTPNMFNFYQLLGKGSFGEVYLVDKIGSENRKLFAMKILKKERMMSQNLLKYAETEKEVLSVMHHPFIVKLNYAFQTESKLFLVMDFCPGGDLSKLLDIKRKLPEEDAKIYVAEILLAIECLHKNNIIFRDLKPENVVLDSEGHALLTDFGLSKKGVTDEELNKSFCGSPAYLPPEILSKQGHNRMADWYGLGVMTYELLVGIPPYYANEREQLFDNIRKGPLKIPRSLSNEAKQFIVALLNRDPNKRLGANLDGEEVREHPWLATINWKDCYDRKLKPPKPTEQTFNNVPLRINFMDTDENKNKITGWSFYEES